MRNLLTYLTASLIVIASYATRRKRDPLASCIEYLSEEHPFDAVEMRIDKYLEGLLQRES